MKTAGTAGYFDRRHQGHLQHLEPKGLRPKTIEAYSQAIRRIEPLDRRIDALTERQAADCFIDLVASRS